VFIMRSCMDEVLYQPGPPNVLRLIKLRRPGTVLPASSSRGAVGALAFEGGGAGDHAVDRAERDAAVEQSAWRMKAVPGQRWGLEPETDERTAEGSRRR
jgi:hypothetical protein